MLTTFSDKILAIEHIGSTSIPGLAAKPIIDMVAAVKSFDFATYARIRFEHGTMEQKRDILMTLGENLRLKDNKLLIEPSKWLIPIGKEYSKIYSVFNKVRTNKKATSKEKEMAMSEICESWRAHWDSNPGHPA